MLCVHYMNFHASLQRFFCFVFSIHLFDLEPFRWCYLNQNVLGLNAVHEFKKWFEF